MTRCKYLHSSLRKLCVFGVITTVEYWKLIRGRRRKQHSRICSYSSKPFDLSKYTDDDCQNLFRFSKFQIHTLVKLLKIPNTFNVHRSKCTGIEGMCVLLRRLSYPNRLCDLVKIFHRDPSTISRMFNYMLHFIYFTNKHRVQSINQNWILTRLNEFCKCCIEAGSWYPNIVGFIDGTSRAICRPKYRQREFYSGYKKQHVLKYQSVVFPNGLIGRLDGPFIGRRHDAAVLNLSNLRQEMETVFHRPSNHYALFGDPGYSNSKYIKVGYKNHQHLNEKQKLFNKDMSSLRVSVEYGFGKIVQLFAFVDFKKNQKLYLQHLQKQYYVAAFLVNCHVCMNGSQVSDYFQCLPPSIQEYLE